MGIYVTGPYLGSILSLSLTNSFVMPMVGNDWRNVMLVYAALVAISGIIWFFIANLPTAQLPSGEDKHGAKFNLTTFREIIHLREDKLILAMSVAYFFSTIHLTTGYPRFCWGTDSPPFKLGIGLQSPHQ